MYGVVLSLRCQYGKLHATPRDYGDALCIMQASALQSMLPASCAVGSAGVVTHLMYGVHVWAEGGGVRLGSELCFCC
jgi:hypothetical protein